VQRFAALPLLVPDRNDYAMLTTDDDFSLAAEHCPLKV
jgi:hypothetical protein